MAAKNVADLIDAIYVQERTDDTDAQLLDTQQQADTSLAQALREAQIRRDHAQKYFEAVSQQSGGPHLILFVGRQQNSGGIAVLRGRCFGEGKRLVHLRPAGLIPGRIQHCADVAIEQLTVQGGILAVHPLCGAVAGAIGGRDRSHCKADAAARTRR